VPQRPPAFQPRTDLFEQITAAKPVTVVQALTGARGVGKTQLAAEYARQCIDEGRPLVAWIPAEEPGQALAGLTELAEALGLRYPGEEATSAVRKVRHWLESPEAEGCLVVFDNAVEVETLRPLLPAAGPARIIITSNYHSFEDVGTAINIDVFSPAEAMAFLRARIESDDEAGAQRLAAEVGRLPLALAQSAGVIRQDGLSYDAFLTRLRELPAEDYLTRTGSPYPLRAAQAVLLAVASVEATDRLARRLLDLLSVLCRTPRRGHHPVRTNPHRLRTRPRTRPPQHPGQPQQLSQRYQAAGRLNDAIALFEQALLDGERVLSPGHPWIDVVSRNLDRARRERERRA
jgi:hypothetical protein